MSMLTKEERNRLLKAWHSVRSQPPVVNKRHISEKEKDNLLFGEDTENWAMAHASKHHEMFVNVKHVPTGTKYDRVTQSGALVEVKFSTYYLEHPGVEILTTNEDGSSYHSGLYLTINNPKLKDKHIILLYLQRGFCYVFNARKTFADPEAYTTQKRTKLFGEKTKLKTYLHLTIKPLLVFPMTTEHWNPTSERGKKLDIERWFSATMPEARSPEMMKAAYLRAMGVSRLAVSTLVSAVVSE